MKHNDYVILIILSLLNCYPLYSTKLSFKEKQALIAQELNRKKIHKIPAPASAPETSKSLVHYKKLRKTPSRARPTGTSFIPKPQVIPAPTEIEEVPPAPPALEPEIARSQTPPPPAPVLEKEPSRSKTPPPPSIEESEEVPLAPPAHKEPEIVRPQTPPPAPQLEEEDEVPPPQIPHYEEKIKSIPPQPTKELFGEFAEDVQIPDAPANLNLTPDLKEERMMHILSHPSDLEDLLVQEQELSRLGGTDEQELWEFYTIDQNKRKAILRTLRDIPPAPIDGNE